MSFQEYLKEALGEDIDVLVWDNIEKDGSPVYDGSLEELLRTSEFMTDDEPNRIRKEVMTKGESIVGGGAAAEWIVVRKGDLR